MTAGFCLASNGSFRLFLSVAIGLSSIIGSACVFNNYIDRYTDKKMARTKDRPLAAGDISTAQAICLGTCLGIAGLTVLILTTSLLTCSLAACGLLIYTIVYGKGKYRSSYGTILGSLSGGIPPLVGYVSVTHAIDVHGIMLFLTMICWQMPHFYALALKRIDEYEATSVVILPRTKGSHVTKIHMTLYIVAFILCSLSFFTFGMLETWCAIGVGLLGCAWLSLSVQGFWTHNEKQWAQHMFQWSLVVITTFSLALCLKTPSHPNQEARLASHLRTTERFDSHIEKVLGRPVLQRLILP